MHVSVWMLRDGVGNKYGSFTSFLHESFMDYFFVLAL